MVLFCRPVASVFSSWQVEDQDRHFGFRFVSIEVGSRSIGHDMNLDKTKIDKSGSYASYELL
jgi:hypothetical protein